MGESGDVVATSKFSSLYLERRARGRIFVFALGLLLAISILLAASIGPANISFREAAEIVVGEIPILGNRLGISDIPASHITIVLSVRLPRIALAALVGAGLSAVGVALQGLFKNPMADPYVLGISSGSALGATVAISFGLSASLLGLGSVPLAAFAGGIGTMFLVYSLARVGGRVPISSLLLSGIVVGSFLSAVVSLIIVLHSHEVGHVIFWLMGGFSARGWQHVRASAPYIILGVAFISFFARDLNIMLLGEESAQNLGVSVERLKKILLVVSSLVTAAAVSVSGMIGFVGLIIPHVVRLLVGPDHRILVPVASLGGAIFLVVMDTLARTVISPTELPVGILTALCGGPFFIYLLRRRTRT
ncbi:MAG: FecCD family ABC transporter permease [bacterium]